MTQRFFPAKDESSNQFEVMVGWDRPLRELFANVFRIKANGKRDGDPQFSTLDDSFSTDFPEELQEWLKDKGFTIPQSILAALDADVAGNNGNIVAFYNADGEVIVPVDEDENENN
ncbi:hypothetical protein F6X40_36305 [Paraburkholderia sp. UCT31]|uniref:hypothetical protein n=1 Tax=Paraburkholderia sp. UCT31 TaxID=2615209 RepID=UPI0016559166|nr:hypothetical protein [Paraburkholderia sp. UCT31]MBC8742004.1 hypothetical protein [Paraburkholderia sp. UCT31]